MNPLVAVFNIEKGANMWVLLLWMFLSSSVYSAFITEFTFASFEYEFDSNSNFDARFFRDNDPAKACRGINGFWGCMVCKQKEGNPTCRVPTYCTCFDVYRKIPFFTV